MRGILLMLLAVVISLNLAAQKKKELSTSVNVNYCLPKVVYEVEVTLECTTSSPGPYASYAAKELGVQPEITRQEEHWYIRNIEVKPRYVPDEKAVYSILATGDYSPVLLNLSAEGFLAGVAGGQVGNFAEEQEMKFINVKEAEEEAIDIMKISTYNYLKEVLDTNYTFQEVYGVMKKIWDPMVHYAKKTENDNIKEAVNEIFRIRSERGKLLGSENNVTDGQSLEIILREFDQIEKSYMSLFMGKQEKRKMKSVFECVLQKMDEPVVAFRFTEKEGIVDAKNVSAQPYLLKIENAIVAASTPVNGDAAGTAIYYRVPAVGDLKLMRGKEELVSFKAIVPQLGEVKKFPVDVISNENLMLEFYPQYGALKSVRRK
ncbi:MAG: DUF4831 family protein [Odoribacter sp.]